MAANRRSTATTLFERLGVPARATTSVDALTGVVSPPATSIPDIAPPPSTSTGLFGGSKYEKQADQATAAAAAVRAVETFVRSSTSLEQAKQEHLLTVAKREALSLLHLANMQQAEAVVLGTMATRIHAERTLLDAVDARDADRRERRRGEELADYDHAIAVSEKRKQAADAKRVALRAEADLHSQVYGDLLHEVAAFNRRTFNDPAEEEAPEFEEAYAEEERRAAIIRAGERRKDEVRRGRGSEKSKREELERIDQATRRALKRYDLGQAGIVMPDDEEE